jgi:hypothetical protein
MVVFRTGIPEASGRNPHRIPAGNFSQGNSLKIPEPLEICEIFLKFLKKSWNSLEIPETSDYS